MAVASAGPYASLHLAPDRYPCQHLTTQFFTGRMPFLSPNQQCQSTDGTNWSTVWKVLRRLWFEPVGNWLGQLWTIDRYWIGSLSPKNFRPHFEVSLTLCWTNAGYPVIVIWLDCVWASYYSMTACPHWHVAVYFVVPLHGIFGMDGIVLNITHK